MIALGKALKAAGKPVTVVALRDFAPLVEEAGLALAPIDSRLDESLDAVSGSARKMAGGEWSYSRAMSAWVAGIAPQVAAAALAAVEPGDLVVAGVLSIDDAVALQEARGCLAVGVFMAPVLPTTSGPSAMVAVRPHGRSILNRWAGRAILAMSAPMCTTTGSHLRNQLNLPRTRALGFVKMLQTVPPLL